MFVTRKFQKMLKICSKCKIVKDVKNFSKSTIEKDGLQNHCKKCNKQWRKDHPTYLKQWYENNKESHKEYYKEYHKKHYIKKGEI